MAEIKTDRLVLRPPAEADLPALASLLGDLSVSRMLARVPHPYRLADAKGWFAMISRPDWEEHPLFAITIEHTFAGLIGIRNTGSEPMLGYWLGKPYWGCGLMSEAARATIAWFFRKTAEEVLCAGAFEDNPASQRIQQKLGFQITGAELTDCLATGQPRREIKTRLTREDFGGLAARGPR